MKVVTDNKNYTDIAEAIRSKGIEGSFKPAEMAEAVRSIPSGGAEITDGIIFKETTSGGLPVKADYYGKVCFTWQFNGTMYGGMWTELTEITFHNTERLGAEVCNGLPKLSSIKGLFNEGFKYLGSKALANLPMLKGTIILPASLEATQSEFVFSASGVESVIDLHAYRITTGFFSGCTSLKSYIGEKITQFWGSMQFNGCSSLETAQFGSIGHAVFDLQYTNTFNGCTNPNLVITFYAKGSYVDTLLAKTRAGATNATIIIKASENTTYNGQPYAAGETMITSEVA